jgi:hypothetical protein
MANLIEDKINTIWNNAQIVPNVDSKEWRKDPCGACMANRKIMVGK